MIVLTVMVRDRPRPPLWGAADMLQAAVQQGQHVVSGIRAEQVIVAAAGQVDGRRMRHDAAMPAIVMPDRGIARSRAASAEPGRPVDLERGPQTQFPRALLVLRAGDDAALLPSPKIPKVRGGGGGLPLHDLQRMD